MKLFGQNNLIKSSLLLVLLVMVFGFSIQSKASHILGAEVTYRYLGNDQYEIRFNILKDGNIQTQFDNPLTYTVRRIGVDTIIMNRQVSVNEIVEVPASLVDPCVVPPPNYIIEQGTYIDTITLPFDLVGYYVTYQRCCWANDILNIEDPEDSGVTVTTEIPGSNSIAFQNSAPSFNILPPVVICTNKDFQHDFSATDLDGDSLAYKMCDPIDYIANGNNFSPDPDFPRPYVPITWVSGFNAQGPFGSSSPVTLDPKTGLLNFTPILIGRHQSSVCVEEYRNGIKINERGLIVNFDIQNCTQEIPFEISLKNEGILINNQGGGVDPSLPKYLSEDCGVHYLEFNRIVDTTEVTLHINIVGSAFQGVDIPDYPDSIVIPVGVKDSTISILAYFDGVNEPKEDFIFSLFYENPCSGKIDTISSLYEIYDYRTLLPTLEKDSLNFCPDLGEIAPIVGNTTQGIPPYEYEWFSTATENLPTTPNFSIGAGILTEPITPFYFVVKDQCQKQATSAILKVYDQCPIIVPNVITLNGDYINDIFVIRNLENYDAVKLKIFNRWGELLYENGDYKNNWVVEHKDGTPLIAGVYFYQAEVVNSEKYEYDNNDRTNYTSTGFFQVLDIK